MPEHPEVSVAHEPASSRYAARVDGDVVGFAAYDLTGDTIVFTHTEVESRCEGMGVGSALARAALDDVRRDGTRTVVARCPFIARWIDHHPDYADLLDPSTPKD